MSEVPWLYRFLDWLRDAPLLARLWLADQVLGPEPPTPADQLREQQHERLRRLFPERDSGRTNSAEH